MDKKLLFDASSIMLALKLRRVELLCGNYLQWLSIYEVLNGLWKEAYLVKSINSEEALAIARVLREMVKHMNILSPRGIEEEILRMALELGITVYDASYIALAKNNGLTLVTEDRKLRMKAEGLINVVSLEEIS